VESVGLSDEENQLVDKEIAVRMETSVVEMNRLKSKIIRTTNRYFFHKRSPSDREIRQIVVKDFRLEPNSGTGYEVFRTGMRTLNNMRHELYKSTEAIADAYTLKQNGYVALFLLSGYLVIANVYIIQASESDIPRTSREERDH
jgi:hypothetical protein